MVMNSKTKRVAKALTNLALQFCSNERPAAVGFAGIGLSPSTVREPGVLAPLRGCIGHPPDAGLSECGSLFLRLQHLIIADSASPLNKDPLFCSPPERGRGFGGEPRLVRKCRNSRDQRP